MVPGRYVVVRGIDMSAAFNMYEVPRRPIIPRVGLDGFISQFLHSRSSTFREHSPSCAYAATHAFLYVVDVYLGGFSADIAGAVPGFR